MANKNHGNYILFGKTKINQTVETSLVVQHLRTHLPTQGTWVWSLIWEQRSHMPWGSKPVLQVLSPLTTTTEDYVLQSPCSATVRSPCAATRKSLLAATQSPWAITKTQCSQKKYELIKRNGFQISYLGKWVDSEGIHCEREPKKTSFKMWNNDVL